MSIEELKAELDRRAKTILAEEIENLPVTLRRLVDQSATKILLACLGFQESFGRWEVNRSNNNNPAIANALGEAALQQIQLAIPDFLKDYIQGLSSAEFIQNAGRRDYKYQFQRRCDEYVDRWLEETAKAKSQEIIASIRGAEEKK